MSAVKKNIFDAIMKARDEYLGKAKVAGRIGKDTMPLSKAEEAARAADAPVAQKVEAVPAKPVTGEVVGDPNALPAPGATAEAGVAQPPAMTPRATTDLELEQVVRSTEQERIGAKADNNNANFGRIESHEDIKTMIDDISRQSAERGEVKPRTTLEEISMKATGKTYESLRDIIGQKAYARAEKILQPEEIVAVREVWVTLADDLYRQATEITSAQRQVTDEQLVMFRENVTKFRAVQEVVQGQTRIAGQLLGSFRIKVKSNSPLKDMEIQSILDETGGRDVTMTLAGDIARAGSIEKVNKIAEIGFLAKTVRFLDSYRYNSMLSAPETHARNITGNAGALAVRFLEKPVAAVAGHGRRAMSSGSDAAIHGQDQQAYLLETVAEIGSLPYGIMEGVNLAFKALKDPDFKVGARNITEQFVFKPAMMNTRWAQKNILSKSIAFMADVMLLNGATRALGAMDVFFKGVVYHADASARAVRQGLSEGLEGAAYVKRVEELAKAPHTDLYTRSLEEMETATFTNRLEGAMADVSRGVRNMPLGTIVVPFMRVLANLTRWSVSRSFPLNAPWIKSAFQNGGQEADQMVAKLATGAILSYIAYDQVRGNRISGSGVGLSQKTKSAWIKSGQWQPNSYRDDEGNWHSIVGFAPVSTVLLYYATLAEMTQFSEDEFAVEDYLTNGAAVFTMMTVDQTFARGLFEWLQAITDPTRYGDRPIKSLASTAVPNWARTIRRAMDPEMREMQTGSFLTDVMVKLMDKTPGLSDNLPPATDYFGRTPEPGYQMFDMTPGRIGKDRNLYEAMIRNGITMGREKPVLKIGGAEVNLYEVPDARGANYAFYQWQRYLGAARRESINEVVNDSSFSDMTPGEAGSGVGNQETQGDVLRSALSGAKKVALERMAEHYPILEELIQKEMEAMTPKTQPVPRRANPPKKKEQPITISINK